jgi:signal transduction histidine kinase
MRISVRNQLISTYLAISIFTALIIYVLTYTTSERRVERLAQDYMLKEMVEEVHHWYAAERSWEGFADYFKSLHPPFPDKKEPERNQVNAAGSKKAGIVTADQRVLLKYLYFQPGELIPEAYLVNARQVTFHGEVIAWIIPPEATGINLNSQLQVFLDNTSDILLISVGVSIIAALVLGVIFAKAVLKPIEKLTAATSAIASGNLDQKIESLRDDEIGDLSRSFNKMSQDLVKAEHQRRQLTADITHDLCTPVQVVMGYIEMAQAGELTLSQERIAIIASELEQIRRLIQDMSLLAQTDTRTLSIISSPTAISALIQRVVRMYQLSCHEKNIDLSYHCPIDLPQLYLDEERMVQVLSNLVSNAIRYVPEGGKISITSYIDQSRLIIKVNDNGCGIHPDHLPFVFDRFYRSDTSRSDASGKMGLGLSISRGLVEMQGGTIRVDSDGHTGSEFIIYFPLSL